MSGTLSSISLYSYGGPTTFTVYIDLGLPWHSGANTFETQVTRPWGMEWFSIDLSSADILLTAGTHFIIGVQGESMLFGSDNTYAGGVLYGRYGENPPFASSGDLAFATYMIPIPEPLDVRAVHGGGCCVHGDATAPNHPARYAGLEALRSGQRCIQRWSDAEERLLSAALRGALASDFHTTNSGKKAIHRLLWSIRIGSAKSMQQTQPK